MIASDNSPATPLFSVRAARSLVGLDGQSPPETAIRIGDLNHYFGQGELRRQVLFHQDLEIGRGEIVIIKGKSGCGKTTLLTLIGALRTVQEGSLRVFDQELRGLGADRLVDYRRQLGFIFQHHNLFESLTALQNVRMAMELKNLSLEAMKARGEELLTALDLAPRIHYRPASLSGGQRQRVAIARALANRPPLILADEPTAALDAGSVERVLGLLHRTSRDDKTTILIVTHDEKVDAVADRVVRLDGGTITVNTLVKQAALVCEFLTRCPLFAGMSPETLAQVGDKVLLEKYDAGAVIIRQGDTGDKFYIIRNGQAEVTVTRDGETRNVATLGEGEFFGEAALLTGEPRNATVRAVTPLLVYALTKDDFQSTLNSVGSFRDQLERALLQRR